MARTATAHRHQRPGANASAAETFAGTTPADDLSSVWATSMTLTINHVISLSPFLEKSLMGLFDDIKGQIEELKAAAATEHEQVLAALAALEAKIGESLTLDEKLQIGTLFAEAKSAIGAVYEPPAPTE